MIIQLLLVCVYPRSFGDDKAGGLCRNERLPTFAPGSMRAVLLFPCLEAT